jgi:thiamine pyrophosphate-dependent acetolactate synthase large subunit-like protein
MLIESDGALARRPLVAKILDGHDDLPVITGLSVASYDSVAARDAEFPLTFNLHGALGGAPMVGLGLALAQPEKRILVLMGDFDFVMGMRCLSSIRTIAPKNISIAVFDNGISAETGGQPTATQDGVDFAAMARAANWPVVHGVSEESEVDQAIEDLHTAPGPVFVNFKVSPIHPGPVKKTRDGVLMKLRFRQALLGEP